MKKLIAVAVLLSLSVCAMSSCEDQTEEFNIVDSQQIEHAKMPIDDRAEGSENEPETP